MFNSDDCETAKTRNEALKDYIYFLQIAAGIKSK